MDSKQQQEKERIGAAIRELAALCDLVAFKTYIGRKTKYGKKPGPEPWHYTRAFLAEYAPATRTEDVQRLFESIGAANEVRACVLLTVHDNLVP